jgi:hypothetical protein
MADLVNEPAQDFVVVPEVALEEVGNGVLEVDQGRDLSSGLSNFILRHPRLGIIRWSREY